MHSTDKYVRNYLQMHSDAICKFARMYLPIKNAESGKHSCFGCTGLLQIKVPQALHVEGCRVCPISRKDLCTRDLAHTHIHGSNGIPQFPYLRRRGKPSRVSYASSLVFVRQGNTWEHLRCVGMPQSVDCEPHNMLLFSRDSVCARVLLNYHCR